MAVVNRILPPHMVAIQLKILIPVGTAIKRAAGGEEDIDVMAHAGGKHMVRPDGKAEQADGNGGSGDETIAEDRLTRKDRNDLGNDPERRQDHDVDLGMSEVPEDVLPQHGRPAASGVKNRPCKLRSISNMNSAEFNAGKARMMRKELTALIQVKSGSP